MVGIVLLAAGESSRLGAPKQLIPIGGDALHGLCDQPRTSAQLLDTLIDRYVATAARVLSSRYADDIIGPPTLFRHRR
jgi:CTP:molybdopterin cytidylyltransferase MocA